MELCCGEALMPPKKAAAGQGGVSTGGATLGVFGCAMHGSAKI
jgi:hypothetical protein